MTDETVDPMRFTERDLVVNAAAVALFNSLVALSGPKARTVKAVGDALFASMGITDSELKTDVLALTTKWVEDTTADFAAMRRALATAEAVVERYGYGGELH